MGNILRRPAFRPRACASRCVRLVAPAAAAATSRINQAPDRSECNLASSLCLRLGPKHQLRSTRRGVRLQLAVPSVTQSTSPELALRRPEQRAKSSVVCTSADHPKAAPDGPHDRSSEQVDTQDQLAPANVAAAGRPRAGLPGRHADAAEHPRRVRRRVGHRERPRLCDAAHGLRRSPPLTVLAATRRSERQPQRLARRADGLADRAALRDKREARAARRRAGVQARELRRDRAGGLQGERRDLQHLRCVCLPRPPPAPGAVGVSSRSALRSANFGRISGECSPMDSRPRPPR